MTEREIERAALIAAITEQALDVERRAGNTSDPVWLRQQCVAEATSVVDAAIATLGPGEELTSLDLRFVTDEPRGN